MRVYIHTDMEGLAGIGDGAMLGDKASEVYRHCQELLSREVNAAARGFIAGGATEIMALDSHGGGGNLKPELLDEGLKYEDNSKQIWWGCLDETWDATCFIGAHAMSGTRGGFLEHTQSSRDWYRYFVSGRETGELGQWAACAGEFGVPMILVTGDDKACEEAREFFDPVVAVETKKGLGRMRAECLELDDAYAKVEAGAKEAMSLIGKAKPFVNPRPATIRWEFCRCAPADGAEGLPGVRRTGSREVEKDVSHAGWSIVPGLLKCQAPEGENEKDGVKVIGPGGKLPPGTGF